MNAYANPDMLVSTDWVAEHLNDANVAIVEVDVDTGAYDEGHVPAPSAGTGRHSSATRFAVISSAPRSCRNCGSLPASRMRSGRECR